MSGLFGTTAGPWAVDRMGDIVSGPLNVCIPYATRKEDKRAIAQVPAMLELVAAMDRALTRQEGLGEFLELAVMARKIVAELESK